MMLFAITFGQNVEGVWTTTIDTDNGPYTFYAKYLVKSDTITGKLYSMDGKVKIYDGKISGDEFEYNFDLDYYKIKHEGKWVDGELKMKSISDDGESEFTMVPYEEEE